MFIFSKFFYIQVCVAVNVCENASILWFAYYFCNKNHVLFQKLLSPAYMPLKKLLKFSNIQYPFVKQKSCPDKEISLEYPNNFKLHSTWGSCCLFVFLFRNSVEEECFWHLPQKNLIPHRACFSQGSSFSSLGPQSIKSPKSTRTKVPFSEKHRILFLVWSEEVLWQNVTDTLLFFSGRSLTWPCPSVLQVTIELLKLDKLFKIIQGSTNCCFPSRFTA